MQGLQTSQRIRSNNRGNSNFFALFPLDAPIWPISQTMQPSESHSLTLNHDCKYFFAQVNGQGENSLISREKDSILEQSTSSCLTSTLLGSSDGLRLKIGNSTSQMSSTIDTRSSTIPESTSSSSENSLVSGESLPSAITFANRCLVRSYERRSRSNLIMLPSYSINLSLGPSSKISITHMSSSIISSSVASRKSSSVASHRSISLSSKSLYTTSKFGSRSSSREQDIKIKLILTKIIIYRQKCARSLSKVITHYNRLNAISGSNHDRSDSSTCNELCIPYALYLCNSGKGVNFNKPFDYLGCSSKMQSFANSTLQEVSRNSPEDIGQFSDGVKRSIFFHRKNSCETQSSMTDSSVFSSLRSNSEDSLSSIPKEASKKSPEDIRKFPNRSRRKIFPHRKTSFETQLTMTDSTTFSSIRSNSEVSFLGEAGLENERVDFTQILINTNCESLAENEIDASIEVCFSSFLSNFMKSVFVQEEYFSPVNWI